MPTVELHTSSTIVFARCTDENVNPNPRHRSRTDYYQNKQNKQINAKARKKKEAAAVGENHK